MHTFYTMYYNIVVVYLIYVYYYAVVVQPVINRQPEETPIEDTQSNLFSRGAYFSADMYNMQMIEY